jgi:microcystin-dependent protein
MAESPYLGAIFLFAGNFAPRGFALCQGQTLPIAQNTALFSILGTTYGGNGQTTFNLPDLRGRAPIGTGQGPSLSNIDLGQAAGTENVSLIGSNLPPHNHPLSVSNAAATASDPTGKVPAVVNDGGVPTANTYLGYANAGTGAAAASAIGLTGNSTPVAIRNPYLGLNYIIATQGVYPSRN